MSTPELPVELTPEEQAELKRQNFDAAHPRFHDSLKCGERAIVPHIIQKRHCRIRCSYCTTHKVIVGLAGYEYGWFMGTDSREMNQQRRDQFNKKS